MGGRKIGRVAEGYGLRTLHNTMSNCWSIQKFSATDLAKATKWGYSGKQTQNNYR